MNIRPGLDQQLDHIGVTIGGGPHQSSLTATFLRVHISATREQQFHRTRFPGARRSHERGFAAAHCRIRVGSGVEKQFDKSLVSVKASQRKRRDTVGVSRLHLSACLR